ncbi:AAA family ATPase, partial [Serratia marcescens]
CKSMKECLIGVRKKRWQDCLEILENDPLFKESDVSKLADFDGNSDDNSWENYVRKYLEKLSSGHLVTLLSITRLIEAIEDRSLTLIDEPEAHLHPPLISA